ncbi:MAG: hypothetical protein JWO44_1497 [Bacteroidetes bacterium]|nr:hypothetical protein [Bacteroidota bacterium]
MSAAEKTYKQLTSFLSKCSATFVSVLKVLLRSKPGIKLPEATSNTCIILGNGPSLKESLGKHPGFFSKHPLVCVNTFAVTEEYTQLKPAYYVMLDPNFWLVDNDFTRKTLNALVEKTSWNMALLVPQQAKRSALFRELERRNPQIRISYYNYTVFRGFESITHWFCKKNLAMLQSQNVLVASIFLSINIGFKEIYLVGADHTWHESLHVNENNMLCIKDVHFYEEKEHISYKPFRVALDSERTHRVDEIFSIWGKTFYGYIAMNNYAKYRGAAIYNASEVSFIDAFKRVKL